MSRRLVAQGMLPFPALVFAFWDWLILRWRGRAEWTPDPDRRCAVQACKLTSVPAHVEVRGRSTLAWRLSEEGKSEEALAILKEWDSKEHVVGLNYHPLRAHTGESTNVFLTFPLHQSTVLAYLFRMFTCVVCIRFANVRINLHQRYKSRVGS